jgi:hypothetical protein
MHMGEAKKTMIDEVVLRNLCGADGAAQSAPSWLADR